MNFSEIKELLNAGFTHDEIMSLVTQDTTPDKTPDTNPDKTPDKTPATNPDKTPDTNPDKTPDTNPDKTPDTNPDNNPDKTPVEKQLEGLTSVVAGLMKAMQESNIINSSINTLPGSDTAAVDSIMASIIRPERKDK